MAADPDQDFIDFVNTQRSPSPGASPGSPTATMTPDPDQDFIDMVNKSRPAPTATSTPAPSRSPYTDQAVQQQSSTLYKASQIGTGTGAISSVAGAAARGFLPGRAMLAAYPLGSVLGAAGVGAVRGALIGAAVPVAGETGVSEAVGGVLGGLIAGGIAAWGASKLQTAAADVVAPQSILGSKAEQAQTAEHPYLSIVGGGLSFGKPNPMNVVRAGKTLASAEGRAALVAFTQTGGKGMAPQAASEIENVINVSMAGGLNSVFNVKEQLESGKFDPTQLAVAATTGLIFNEPWFHKPNPAAAAAAKVINQGGVPKVGPSEPVAPPGIASPEIPGAPSGPGVIPPPAPRVPGLLDFEIHPSSETARAPEEPLPEAPIPRPGTEGGTTDATQTRQVPESRVEEHIGVSSGENLPAHPEEVRTQRSEQAGDSGRAGAAAEEPVRESPYFIQEDPLGFSVVDREANKIVNVKSTREEAEARVKELEAAREPAAPALTDLVKQVEVMPTDRFAGYDFTPEQKAAILAREAESETPYSIKEDNGVFRVVDSRRPDALTIPFNNEESALKRKAVLDKTFLAQVAQGVTEKGADETAKELLKMQREHEASLLEEAQGHQARGGDELLDAVAEHGVPLNDPTSQAELNMLKENFAPKNKYGQEKHRPLATGSGEKLYFGDVFRANAGSTDSLAQFLKRKGFSMPDGSPIETRGDALQMIDERLRSGEKVYGDEARAQNLEEQSYGDYQGPMYAKHPFGGFFQKKEPAVEPIKNPEVLHQTLEADKDKGVKVVESTGADNEPGEKILEMGMNRKQIARRLNKDAYEGSIANVSVKELLQNAFDSVRGGNFTNENPGRIFVNVDPHARTIDVNDVGYGKGMTPETVEKAFFTIGGTLKETSPENTSGGIGVAKIAFMYGAKRVRLETVRDGIKSVVDASGAQIEDGFFKLVKTRTNEPNGTKVHVEIPETFIDDNGETKHIYFEREPKFLKEPLFGPVEVIYNGAALPNGIYTKGWQKDNVFNFGWGHVDVYVDPRPAEDPEYKVMSAGLHQFDVSKYTIFGMNTENAIKHNMVFDVRSHVRADHADYPFNNQREGFQPNRKQDLQDMWSYLQREGINQRLMAAKEDFKKVQVMPDVDIEKNLTAEDKKAIEDSFTQPERPTLPDKVPKDRSVTFTPDKVITTEQGGKETTQPRQTYGIGERTFQPEKEINFENTKLDVSKLDPSKPLFHNNTNVDYDDIHGSHELFTQLGNSLVKFMRHFGEKLDLVENYGHLRRTDPGGWFGGIALDKGYGGLNMMNPFKAIWFNPGQLSVAAVHSPDAAAAETMHTFLHEITHVPQRNEGAGFTWEMKVNYGRMKAYKVEYQKYEKILENIYAKHMDALRAIRERHESYDTRNRSASFESGSKVGPESRKGETTGTGASSEHAPEDVGVQEPGRTGTGRAGEADRKTGSTLGDIISGEKPGQVAGAEPAHPEVAAPAPELPGRPAAAPVPEGVSGRSGVAGIKDTLAGIKEAAAQPPETPEQRKFAPRSVETGDAEPRPPTPNEAAGPGLRDLSDQQMSQVISNSLQQFHETDPVTSLNSSGGLSHNDIIDAGRMAIRHGVDPEAVAASRAIPEDQKYTVVRAHAEDLRDVAAQAEDFARKNPSQVNKDAADAAFADYSNWDKETVRPLRQIVDEKYPGMPPEEYNPRSMTDLRQQMIRQNNRDFTTSERSAAEENLRSINKAVEARNKELMKYDAELKKDSPDLKADIKNGDDLFKYVADVMKNIFPCT